MAPSLLAPRFFAFVLIFLCLFCVFFSVVACFLSLPVLQLLVTRSATCCATVAFPFRPAT